MLVYQTIAPDDGGISVTEQMAPLRGVCEVVKVTMGLI